MGKKADDKKACNQKDRAGAAQDEEEEETKTTTTKKDKQKPMEERYDYSRTQNIEVPVMKPCMGKHEVAAFYKGSPTGLNQHGHWTGCEKCKQRLSYTPAYGAHGIHRKAGPLPADLQATTNRLGKAAAYSEEMKPREVALEGAERSLEQRLAVIRAQRARGTGSAAASTDAKNTTPLKSKDKDKKTTTGRTTAPPVPQEDEEGWINPGAETIDLTMGDSSEEGGSQEPERS